MCTANCLFGPLNPIIRTTAIAVFSNTNLRLTTADFETTLPGTRFVLELDQTVPATALYAQLYDSVSSVPITDRWGNYVSGNQLLLAEQQRRAGILPWCGNARSFQCRIVNLAPVRVVIECPLPPQCQTVLAYPAASSGCEETPSHHEN